LIVLVAARILAENEVFRTDSWARSIAADIIVEKRNLSASSARISDFMDLAGICENSGDQNSAWAPRQKIRGTPLRVSTNAIHYGIGHGRNSHRDHAAWLSKRLPRKRRPTSGCG
jgi:hypothetical protein